MSRLRHWLQGQWSLPHFQLKVIIRFPGSPAIITCSTLLCFNSNNSVTRPSRRKPSHSSHSIAISKPTHNPP